VIITADFGEKYFSEEKDGIQYLHLMIDDDP
jgi:hypothetical protein